MDNLTVLYLVADSAPPVESTTQFDFCREGRNNTAWGLVGLQLLAIAAIVFAPVYSVLALQAGYQDLEVSELQQTLRVIGYYHGPITGYYGIVTQTAIRRFQADHGLIVDGIVGPQTLRALQSATDSLENDWDLSIILELGSRGSAVVQLQQNLQVIGYYDGPITGYYGVITQGAVEMFQVAIGIRLTGRVDADTLAALEAEIYASGADDSPFFMDSPPDRGEMRRNWDHYKYQLIPQGVPH